MSDEKNDSEVDSPEIHFEPIVNVKPVEFSTLEENEEEILKLRARLYRYAIADGTPEWKERGTGYVKLLKHKERKSVRILMRRDKTLKICANHYVLPQMNLQPNCGSEIAFVWQTPSDFADEEAKEEILAIKFSNKENAQKFKSKFDEAAQITESAEGDSKSKESESKDKPKEALTDEEKTDKLTKEINKMKVKDGNTGNKTDEEKAAEEGNVPETTAEGDNVPEAAAGDNVQGTTATGDSVEKTIDSPAADR